jgi:hypothetical protein
MLSYQRANNIAGWAVFVIAAFTYLSTIEPSVSFWDCGEFLSACYKMQVVHPPGAPAFLLLGRIAMLFGSPETGAMMVNAMNALASALTILFLFWSITHYARKLLDPTYSRSGQTEALSLPTSQLISILLKSFLESLVNVLLPPFLLFLFQLFRSLGHSFACLLGSFLQGDNFFTIGLILSIQKLCQTLSKYILSYLLACKLTAAACLREANLCLT